MSTGIILKEVLADDHKTSALQDLCKRVLYKKSTCSRCVNICPQDAISLNPGPNIKDGCTDCGLCQAVCPTEVFQNELSSDRNLLSKAEAIYKKNRILYPGGRKLLFFHCHRADKQDRNSLFLHCLGRITPNIILGTALMGFDKIVLTKGNCSQCHYHLGEKLIKNVLTTSQMLLESKGVTRFAIKIEEKEKCKQAVLSRRDLFSMLSDKIKNGTASFVHRTETTIKEKLNNSIVSKGRKRPSPQMKLLKMILRQNSYENKTVIKYKPELSFGKIKVDEKGCSACGACISLCPTGAITKKRENDFLSLYVNTSLCNNCTLCKEACPQNAIDFETNIDIEDILGEKSEVIARIKLVSCTICGEKIANEQRTRCSTCRKRYG
ncbi:4Fe-4S binding protein [Candidatus Scalindua japonica]|uniref:4Fe-4S binding protein n=1 Tax=Candidatus Scalindua japonica TaxID=1284222 RepID=UPI000BDF6871|nr:4Fe-4S binding protein [Candidatus Scalindua japonica]